MKAVLHKILMGGVVCSLTMISDFSIAQYKDIQTVKAYYTPRSLPELMNTISIGFGFEYKDHSTEYTKGFQGGNINWNRLDVTTLQGIFHNGQLTFDRKKVWENNHRVTFHIKINGKAYECNLTLPHVEKIRFNLYTDSLKRGEAFYLNVEGKFSNGHIYPLDTGMVSFRRSGGGILSGQSLFVGRRDSSVHSVMVYTWLTDDPPLRDSVWVPVKILPDPTHLPSKEDVLYNR